MPDTAPETTSDLLQIGEVADRVGLSLRTVRYYEEQVERLALIKQMKPLGFTVQEMRELLDARDTARDASASSKARAAARQQLANYATSAAERCDKLRRQLQQAEGLADELRAESALS